MHDVETSDPAAWRSPSEHRATANIPLLPLNPPRRYLPAAPMTIAANANAASTRGSRPWPLAAPLVTLPLAAFTLAHSAHLWREWVSNPDLSHGLFAPLVFILLLGESRRNGTPRWIAPGVALTAGTIAASLASVMLFVAAGLFAASLGWTHALVYFVLAASLAAALFAGLLCLADDRVRIVPFNWPALTAIGLWLLAAPIPDGTYARLTLGLQGMVTTGVLNVLHTLGIPAQQIGNVIELPNTSVGVEEACSGIRSLLSCTYAGFLFAGWLVRGAARRAVIIIAAPLLAIAMNFVRSLGLTLLANAGTDITGFWHDATGYAILGVTAIFLAALVHLGGRAASPAANVGGARVSGRRGPAARTANAYTFTAAALAVIALATFFLTYRPTQPASSETAPDLMSLLPAEAPGWHVRTPKDLYQFSDTLRTRHLGERTYLREVNGEVIQFTAYVAYWASGQAPVSQVASHTPDACWPGSGWSAEPAHNRNLTLLIDGRELRGAEQRFFTSAAYPQYVWFWHIYDGRILHYRDPYSIPALLELALRYGFRRQGSQYFIRLSSNQPWEILAADPLVQNIVANLEPLGLAQ